MRRIDLHVHTTASDGTFTPAQVVELARDAGLSAIAITDHDTVSGYAEAAKRGAELGVEIVPGIEISTKYGGAVHVLGYYIDMESDGLHHILDWIVEDRDTRGRKMAELMAADGLPVNYDEMKARFGEVIGRPHFARLLVELGLAMDVQDAFDRYVEKGQKYYVGRTILPIERAIGLIIKAGGVPVQARRRGAARAYRVLHRAGAARHGVLLYGLLAGAVRVSRSARGRVRAYKDRRQRFSRREQETHPARPRPRQARSPLRTARRAEKRA